MEQTQTETQAHPLDRILARVYTLNWETIAYIVIFVLAVLTRFGDLGTRVMSHDESLHTKFSWDLYRNGHFEHTPLMHGPLLFHATAFFYTLFGDTDFSARIYPALIGVAVVMMPVLFRRWLGRYGALLTSTLFLISPMLMYYSRYIRHDLPAIFFALVMVYATFQYIDGPENVRRKSYWLIILAAAMSLLLASKEVGFAYIAIFGSFLVLYWLIRVGQQYLSLRVGRTLLYLLSIGVILGIIATLAFTMILTIIPPGDVDKDNIADIEDNCPDVHNPAQTDVNADGLGDDCSGEGVSAPPVGENFSLTSLSLFWRLISWSLAVVAVLVVVVIGSALWVFRSVDARQFPWREIILIVLVAALVGSVLLIFEDLTRDEPVTAEPIDPNAEDGVVAEEINNTPIIVTWVVGVALVAAVIGTWTMGLWEEFKRFPVFDVLIVMGTLILPWLVAFVIDKTGASPTDYSMAGIERALITVIPFLAVSLVVGLAWNWRVWLPAAGVFLAIYVFFFTTMFTNGDGIASGAVGSLGYWLEQQGVRRGNQPQYYYLLMTPFYEFLPLLGAMAAGLAGLTQFWRFRRSRLDRPDEALFAADGNDQDVILAEDLSAQAANMATQEEYVAELSEDAQNAQMEESQVVTRPRNVVVAEWLDKLPFVLFVGYWAMTNIMFYTIAGEKMPWLTTHITVPLGLLAGWYGGRVLERTSWDTFLSLGWRLLVFVPLFALAFMQVVLIWSTGQSPLLSLFDPEGLTQPNLANSGSWLAALAVAGGALYYMVRILVKIGGRQFFRTVMIGLALLLAVITARAALVASFINYDRATEYLVYAHAAPGIQIALDTIEEISLRTTDGMDIVVAYDDKSSWPMSWYLRNYENAVFFGSSPNVQALDDAVAVVIGDSNRGRVEPLLGNRYYRFDHIRLWWPMQDYFDLRADRIDSVFDFNSQNANSALLRRGLWEIWWNRDYDIYGEAVGRDFDVESWPVADRMVFYVRRDVAAQIWDMGVGAEVADGTEALPSVAWEPRVAAVVWGQQGIDEGALNEPRGLAVAADGTVYVADSLNHRIQAFDSDGNFLFSWGTYEPGENGEATGGNFNQPWGIAVGPEGNVYVADTWNHRVQVFTPDGEFIQAWGRMAQLDTSGAIDTFWGPREVAVDEQGLIYVADTGNKRIRVYSLGEDGNVQLVRDLGGVDSGLLNEPVGIAIHPDDGRVFVADTWNRRIQVFDQFGQPLNEWMVNAWFGQTHHRPYLALDVGRGQLYVTDHDAARIIVYDFNGNPLGSFGQPGAEFLNETQFNALGGIAIDAVGRVFIADAGGGRILRFAPWDEIAVSAPELDVVVTEEVDEGSGDEATEEVTGEVGEDPTEEITEEIAGEATEEITEELTEEVTEEITGEVTEEATEETDDGA